MRSSLFSILALSTASWGFSPGDEFFEKKIRPVLSTQCIGCHNAKLKAPFGGLRLDTKTATLKGGDSGPILVPGKPEESLILKALSYENRKLQMPPTGRLSDAVIEDFRQWIAMGAPDTRIETAPVVSRQETKPNWAFELPVRVPVPKVIDQSWPRTNVDRFLLAKLESKQLHPAAALGRREFLRRISFDLIGLPPTPAEIKAYLSDASANADEKLVDRLLGSPHYGERWARHWLDLVRFAETNGHEFDNEKPDAWRYRDYVIRALNQDLPYDQFIREHFAGDLLSRPRLSQDGSFIESPIATGFFWFGEVLNSATDSVKTRADRVDNQLDVLSKTFNGLTLSCARCHDHKFDPLPTKDYYAMAGIMHSSYSREAVIDSPQRVRQIEEARVAIAKQHKEPTIDGGKVQFRPGDQLVEFKDWRIEGQAFAATLRGTVANSRGEGSMALTGSLTSGKFRMPKMYMHVRVLGSTPDKRVFSGGDLRVTLVADDHKTAHFFPLPDWQWKTTRMTKEIGRECYFEIVDRSRTGYLALAQIVLSDDEKPPTVEGGALPSEFVEPPVEIPETTFALVSMDEAPNDIKLHIRGSHENLGPPVPRGFMNSVLKNETPIQRDHSGRLELAEWVASAKNPLTARVIVNRVWQHHFGQGLVRSVDNFGRMGEEPSNQQLLDTLAVEFIEEGWSLKKLHRKIMLSVAYHMAGAAKQDPRNDLLSHMPPRRLDAESLRDSMLAVSGSLDQTPYGPSVMPHVSAYQDGRGKPVSGPLDGKNRRSIYIQVRRNFLSPIFLTFDYPLPISTLGARGSSTVPAQALLMMNNEFVLLQAQRWAEASASQSDRLGWLYETAFAREALPQERALAEDYLKTHDWTSLCHVLLNTAEFLYVQ